MAERKLSTPKVTSDHSTAPCATLGCNSRSQTILNFLRIVERWQSEKSDCPMEVITEQEYAVLKRTQQYIN